MTFYNSNTYFSIFFYVWLMWWAEISIMTMGKPFILAKGEVTAPVITLEQSQGLKAESFVLWEAAGPTPCQHFQTVPSVFKRALSGARVLVVLSPCRASSEIAPAQAQEHHWGDSPLQLPGWHGDCRQVVFDLLLGKILTKRRFVVAFAALSC